MSRLSAASAAATLSLVLGCTAELAGPGGPSAGAGTGSGAASGSGNGASAGSGPGTSGQGGTGSGVGGSAGSTGGIDGVVCTPEVMRDTGESILRRLSLVEYRLTLQDLFALAGPPSVDAIPADIYHAGFSTVAQAQTISSAHLRGYLDTAKAQADALFADANRSASVIGCDRAAADCLPAFIARFGRLAFRRPLEQAEVDGIVQAATANALDATDRFRFAVETLLTSPSFLYRVEVGDPLAALSDLTPYELASRLSFALWGRAPSGELLDRAAAGELGTPEGLGNVAAGMVADPRARGFFAAFFQQWLGYETLRPPTQPAADWSDALLPAMQAETDQFLGDYAWGGRNLLESLTANRTRVSPALATFYGLPAPAADGTLEFPAGHARANTGLLTHASLLGAKSDGDPIALRGNWLRRAFLCEEVEPVDLGDIGEELVGLTRIQIVQKRNTEASCAGCHALIDPIGVTFAEFDATGRFDPTLDLAVYGVQPALPDAPVPEVASIMELSQKVAALPSVPACMAEKTFLYVNGREPSAADACAIDTTTRLFAERSYDFAALVRGLVETPAFRRRRAPTL